MVLKDWDRMRELEEDRMLDRGETEKATLVRALLDHVESSKLRSHMGRLEVEVPLLEDEARSSRILMLCICT